VARELGAVQAGKKAGWAEKAAKRHGQIRHTRSTGKQWKGEASNSPAAERERETGDPVQPFGPSGLLLSSVVSAESHRAGVCGDFAGKPPFSPLTQLPPDLPTPRTRTLAIAHPRICSYLLTFG